MDEKDFELLEVLDETRNITHAADKLYMTQSALSKRIKSMEQELGVEILLRSRQGIRFTPAEKRCMSKAVPPSSRWSSCAAGWTLCRARCAAP